MIPEVPDDADLVAMMPVVTYGDGTDGPAAFGGRRCGARHLSAVLPAVSAAIGHPVATPVHRDPARLQRALGLPDASRAVVVLVDGLGFWNLVSRAGHAPYLRSLLGEPTGARPLSTCIPSTTAAAMGVFGTGTCPGMTGMAGYTQLNPRTGELCQIIQFRGAERPAELQRRPTVFESLAGQGVRVTSCGLPRFADSPLTQAALRGTEYVSADSPAARIALAAKASRTPGLTYMYVRDVDKSGHSEGWDSQSWVATLERVDSRLARLRRSLPQGTLVVIVADHGMVSSDPAHRIDVAVEPALSEGVRLIGGEPRAPMLYVGEGTDPAAVADRWRRRLEGHAVVALRDEAVDSGLMGPVEPRVLSMLGDVLVWAGDRTTIVDSRTQSDMATRLPGVHGSRTMLETDIPCLVDVA
ncbi:alkaline phosphatase family protein [uncultured Bifidobacterium sp.]|uniref:alkaline phosphatase family protein n=1 Tax=uncultured Bifidobacterium sp. TaxID=165187 RepID=UPI0028DC2C9D|nr:alkaline phosphatase family protein [uncultured Bifidobacterium sp.]